MERKRKENETRFFRALEAEATHQIARSEYWAEPDKIKIDELIKPHNRYYYLKETNTIH